MTRYLGLLGVVLLATAAGCQAEAHATTGPAEPHSNGDVRLEHAGWEKIGQREVQPHVEHEAVEVGRADGRFKALVIEVKEAPIELFDVVVTFGDGERFEPKTRLVFDANTRSRQIDLPGNERVIKRIDFKMAGLSQGTARVEVFGR